MAGEVGTLELRTLLILPDPISNHSVTFQVFTAVSMTNVVLWDIKIQVVSHRKDITFSLHSPAGYCYVIFEVFTAVIMKNAVFWDVTPCGVSV
jgi:hypothetical protein